TSPPQDLMTDSHRIPVTVLTGILRSGKTTLLNRILTENHGQRIAVIENEFGEIGVDNELVIGAEEEIFEMNNGCICCTVRGDLIRILGSLMKRKGRFDYVMIETTGLADPGPVAQTFFVDDDLRGKLALDGILEKEPDFLDGHHHHQHEHEEHDHQHDDTITSVGMRIAGDLDEKKLNDWIRELVMTQGPDLFRIKGILSIKGDPHRFVFQG